MERVHFKSRRTFCELSLESNQFNHVILYIAINIRYHHSDYKKLHSNLEASATSWASPELAHLSLWQVNSPVGKMAMATQIKLHTV